jgi:hypothetical protein
MHLIKIILNWMVKPLGLKVIQTTDVFEWVGGDYILPVRFRGRRVMDKGGKQLPIKLLTEHEARMVAITINRAMYKDSY